MHSQLIEHIIAISERFRISIRSAINANELGIGAMHVRSLTVIAQSDACTANHIVNVLARDKAQVARIVKELLAADLIEKCAHPEDKRSQILSVKAEGQTLMAQFHTAKVEIYNQMTQGLSGSQLRDFEHIAQCIADNLLAELNKD
ncbi:MarR family winged helix-turn-helix transcriptional regulator [Paraglaciecola polaris]|uniref:MarR family winged helix-turn-helix transcriptional regulator n=1 Tax=Paraglaciecola polaris TaxID=222814 RepID=UPI0030EE638B|tara:strand:- start:3056 stop:3493 length:438 start_codon:yes stop_codon:yes gene_type:complete